MKFGEYIKQLREDKGIGLRELANLLGITASYLTDIEKGRRYAPHKERLDEMIKILNIQDTEKFYDLAGETREGIPVDVMEIIKDNPELISYIRNYKKEVNVG